MDWITTCRAEALLAVGLRDFASYLLLRRDLRYLLCIHVTSSDTYRSARPQRTNRRSLAAADATHTAWGIDKIFAEADLSLHNNGSIEELNELTSAVVIPLVEEFLSRATH